MRGATVKEMGWKGIQHGALLALARQYGFEVLITGDKNLSQQQNPAGRTVALVVFSETRWQVVRSGSDRILEALIGIAAGGYREVALARPGRVRRPRPDRPENVWRGTCSDAVSGPTIHGPRKRLGAAVMAFDRFA